MQTTGNLGLKKPEGTDIVDIADLNGNMDILDTTVNNKVDKVTGKQLSTNDYTAAEKTKLAGIATGANNYAHPNHTGDVTSNGDGVTAIAPGVIVDADVSASAAIAWSKLNKTGASLADLPTRSAADLNSGTLPAARLPAISGDITMAAGTSSAAITAGVIVNADVNANAAIAFSKINSADSIMDSDISSEAYINMKKIGAGLVDNTKLGYLSGVTSDIQTQLNNKASLVTTPQQTTADITYYVSTVGNDSATGLSPGTAFKTIAKAISMIPTVVNHTVTIMVTAGTYTGDIYVAGFCGQGTVAISGAASAATTHTITGSAIVTRCSCRVTVIGINSTVTTNKAFVAYNANEVLFQYCRTDVSTAQSAFWIDHAKAYVVNCIIVGKTDTAITAYVNSEVLVQDCTGSANRVGHRAAYGGRLQISGSFIGSSIKMETNEGGIVTDSIGVINPWGDNTMYARSVMRASMGSAATIAPNAFSKLPFNVMHQDFSNEFNTTLNRFTAKKTGWYLVSGSVSLGPIAPGNAISLSVFVNGNRELDIGSFSPSGVAGPGTATQGAACLYLPAGAFVELFCYPSIAVTTYAGSTHTHFTVTQIA
ncbi:hypothetical protein NSQ91_09105 [Paenibacillus sp. FSL R7-0048]|uniref:hypothetical protein n=1 Tax=Paenibacillus sp. FSL R7-0048 TaxID=2954528 RepID=UPI0030F92C9A